MGELSQQAEAKNMEVATTMQFCFIRDSVSLVMPVTPGSYQWSSGKRVETINISQLGDVYRPGGRTRFSGSFEFLLPAQEYPWMEAGSRADPQYYLDYLSAWAAYIEENRPIGAAVTVVSVAEREIPLTASVTLVEGYTADQVADQLEAAVNELLASQPFGATVTIPFSRFLACLLQCPGVADYSVYTVDGASAAVTINAGDAPVVGTIIIT